MDHDELGGLDDALGPGPTVWTLLQDVVLAGELVRAGAEVTMVGGKSVEVGEEEARELIEQCILRRRGYVRVVLRVQRAPFPWCLVLRTPFLTFFLTVAGSLALIATGIDFASIGVDTSTESFMESDGEASLKYTTLVSAREAKKEETGGGRRRLFGIEDDEDDGELGAAGDRRLQGSRLHASYSFELIYAAKREGTLLSAGALAQMAAFERAVRSMPSYRALCDTARRGQRHLCDPGLSFVNAAYAAFEAAEDPGGADELVLNGSGAEAIPLPVAVELARRSRIDIASFPKNVSGVPLAVLEPYIICKDDDARCRRWAVEGRCDEKARDAVFMRDFCAESCGLCGASTPSTGEMLRVVRAAFTLTPFCCFSGQPGRKKVVDALKARWEALLAQLSEAIAAAQYPDIEVFYKAGSMEYLEAFRALSGDLRWGVAAYIFVSIYATLYLRSPLLSCVGLFLILLSMPAALAIFTLLSGVTKVSLMMCLSVFILIGIGSDMLFVYTDFWTQSLTYSRDPQVRVRFVYTQAASSTAATTFTTAMSFYANLASALRPLREFGFFMGTCVSLAWLLVFLAYPSLLVIGERCHRRLHRLIVRTAVNGVEYERNANSLQLMMESTSSKVASVLDPEGKVSWNCTSILGNCFAPIIYRLRYIVLLTFAALTGWSAWMCMVNAQQDGDVPQVLPPNHHVVRVKAFESTFEIIDRNSYAGVERGSRCPDIFGDCSLQHCLGALGGTVGNETSCECFRHRAAPGGGAAGVPDSDGLCPAYAVRVAVVGSEAGTTSAAQLRDLVAAGFPGARAEVAAGGALAPGHIYSMQWESGLEEFRRTLRSPNVSVRLDPAVVGCAASFANLTAGTELGRLEVDGITEPALDAACCGACAAHDGCEFWVREAGAPGPRACWLRRGPRLHRPDGQFRGAWRQGAEFQDLAGEEIAEAAPGLDRGCCEVCAETPGCEFWLRNGTGPCLLMRAPGEHRPSTSVRGGWRCQSLLPEQCEEDWACYCKARPCAASDAAAPRGRLSLSPLPAAAPLPLRRLQEESSVPKNQRAEVLIAMGLEVTQTMPVLGESSTQPFGFLSTFNLADPWSQRQALALCSEFPPALKVDESICWLQRFLRWRTDLGQEFPVRDTESFHGVVSEFVSEVVWFDHKQTADFMWFEDDRLVATYAIVMLDFSRVSGSGPAYEMFRAWDAHLAGFNQRAEASVRGAWHASSLWVRSEAEKVIIDSTLITIAISLLCVFIGVGVFTRSVSLAIIVMCAVLCVIICLLFFMVVIMGWKIGAIEVLSLIVFVGFAVDYCLHIAHKYHSCHIAGVHNVEDDEAQVGEDPADRMDTEPRRPSSQSRPSSQRWSRASSTLSVGTLHSWASGLPAAQRKVTVTISEYRAPRASVVSGKLPHQQLGESRMIIERYERTKYALSRMGSSVISSAVTTIGCAAFLLPCTIYIFFKIGAVVIGVTAYAVVYALLPLPAVLMVIGPATNDSKFWKNLFGVLGGLLAIEEHDSAAFPRRSDGAAPPARRFVLNLPTQGVACSGERCAPTRTLVVAGG